VVVLTAADGAPRRAPAAAAPAVARAVLIVNPAARRAARAEARAAAAFARAGVACEVRRTARPGHAAELAAARGDADAVFVLGGDGTAMEVVGALAGTGVPVGIVPGGTGNLVARVLGIPLDPARAVAALLAGAPALVDLGLVRAGAAGAAGGAPGPWRHFAFSAGVGIDAHMIERTPAAWKRRVGVLAYAAAAARATLSGRTFAARVSVDGWEWSGDAATVMVANFGAVLGDRLPLGPGIRADDGLLDLCVLAPRSRVDALRALARLARRDFRPDPALVYRAGVRFRVETAPARPAQADGELIGATPLEVEAVPRAATLLLPPRRG
jgi:YegS/Rv2252/BmrU family lipid kinase